jgi:two-component system, chemotaxis family, CheB/CheR fusion protein
MRKQPTKSKPEVTEDIDYGLLPRKYIVGLGSSAGGLEALTAFISKLPKGIGASYVIVQHMSPTHRSMLAQLLARETEMAVKEIEDGSIPLPDEIYVTPPNRNVIIQDGKLILTEPAAETVPKPSVNTFFTSLAEEKGEDAIAIVLSGTGSDGAVGVRAIKASGGLVFAQEPTTAKYTGMPQAAIETDCVDWIMSPEKIAAEIAVIVEAQGDIVMPKSENELSPITIRSLLRRVMKHAKVDFTGYKEATVWRRILRRMVSNRINSLEDYFVLTEKNPDELNQLAKEILISVTSFFRDHKSFEKLKECLTTILQEKEAGDEIRIWVAGCATGEEAYSIAIEVSEILGTRLDDIRIQIFATDIDLNAMAVARKASYPEGNLSEIQKIILDKYFINKDGYYEVSKQIRDMVVFARQDLVQDPPFLRLDLITCRNVLIYFKSPLQEQVLSTFHYALKTGGLLFLGKSETAHQYDSMFKSISKDAKIFSRREGDARLPSQNMNKLNLSINEYQRPATTRSKPTFSQEEYILKAVVETALPTSVMVDSQLEIKHVFGDASAFLKIPSGRMELNLVHLLKPEWKIEAQTLIYQALQKKCAVIGRLLGGEEFIRLTVRPISISALNENFLLLSFEQVDPESSSVIRALGEEPSDFHLDMEEELNATREHLQTVIEELETSNEETQALNEELQASNEELQASNEELQASNEELQSTNEELTTVNEELQIKTAELAVSNADLENIQNSIGFIILMVNDQMRIVRFNSVAAAFLNLGISEIGESLYAISNINHLPDFVTATDEVLKSGCAYEKQVVRDGKYYQLRALPRLMYNRESKGVVITLTEESELAEAQRKLRENEHRLMSIMNYSSTAVAIKDLSGRYEYANPRYCQLFNVKKDMLLGKTDKQLFSEAVSEKLRELELDALRADKLLQSEEMICIDNSTTSYFAIRFPLKNEDGVIYAMCIKLAASGTLAIDV